MGSAANTACESRARGPEKEREERKEILKRRLITQTQDGSLDPRSS